MKTTSYWNSAVQIIRVLLLSLPIDLPIRMDQYKIQFSRYTPKNQITLKKILIRNNIIVNNYILCEINLLKFELKMKRIRLKINIIVIKQNIMII